MPSPRWRKALADLAGNRTRTTLVVLSIGVGVLAIGMIGGSEALFSHDLNRSYLAVNPAAATLTIDPAGDDLIDAVRHVRGVGDAEGRRTIVLRTRLGAGEWKEIQLTALGDFDHVRVDRPRPTAGAWPPPKRGMLIERASLDYLGAKIGDALTVELQDGKQTALQVAGAVHDLTVLPADLAGMGSGYVTLDTIERLGAPRSYNELHVTVAANPLDKEHVREVAGLVQAKVEKSGRTVYATTVPEPGQHPLAGETQAFVSLLGTLGFLSLLLSAFLVANTISALMLQQTRQIGIMKAIGARRSQIGAIYLVTVLGFGLLALVVGIPAGWLGAWAMGSVMAGLLNFDVTGVALPPQTIALQGAVGLLVPVLAALWPIVAGTRITVREAIAPGGSAESAAQSGPLWRLIERTARLPRPLLLSLRNTFRRRGRLALTLVTLTLGGAIFVGVFTVRESLLTTLDGALAFFHYDFEIAFRRPLRAEQIVAGARQTPGVASAESVSFASIRRLRASGYEGNTFPLAGVDATTPMLRPEVLQGRWLLPDDEDAVVINSLVLKDEPDLKVGDHVVFKLDRRETSWRVAGVVRGVVTGPVAYANRPYFERIARTVGHGERAWIIAEPGDPAGRKALVQVIQDRYRLAGAPVASATSVDDLHEQIASNFGLIVVFLLVMAALFALVGAIGLAGTMSLNVIERTREIGVMRAIGASNSAVRQIVVVEGIAIGVLSWFLGVALAYPLGRLMSDAVGEAFLQAPLTHVFSTVGAVFWLAAVIVLATLASVLPARSAARLSVRDTLAYE